MDGRFQIHAALQLQQVRRDAEQTREGGRSGAAAAAAVEVWSPRRGHGHGRPLQVEIVLRRHEPEKALANQQQAEGGHSAREGVVQSMPREQLLQHEHERAQCGRLRHAQARVEGSVRTAVRCGVKRDVETDGRTGVEPTAAAAETVRGR